MLTYVKYLLEPKIFRRKFVHKKASHVLCMISALFSASTTVYEPRKCDESLLQNYYIMPTFPNSSTLIIQRARDTVATIMQPQIRNGIIIMGRASVAQSVKVFCMERQLESNFQQGIGLFLMPPRPCWFRVQKIYIMSKTY
jgi:hypothetical protein